MEQATNQIQELTLQECDEVSGGIFIILALKAIWDSASSASGGNGDMSSWYAA